MSISLPPLPPDIAGQGPPDPRPKILEEIAAFLADWPLYRTYKYDGYLWARENVLLFPDILRLYCDEEECKRTQTWQRRLAPYSGELKLTEVNNHPSVTYRCRNCQRSEVVYFLHFDVNHRSGQITKVGQWPPLSREPDPVVVAGWSKDDKLMYRDAMTFRNGNKGIGALPYLRRIIENHIQGVLDLIGEANQRSPIAGFDLAGFEVVRTSHRFSDKLDFARDHLPAGLTPGGPQSD